MVKIKCSRSGEIYEFDDDGSVDCMPDGYILPNGEWVCDTCGSCPNCGRTLEDEPEKRAHIENGVLVPAQICEYCIEEAEEIKE